MTALLVVAVSDDAELDRVVLDDEGRLAYRTGAARGMFEARRRVLGGVSDADLVEYLTGWSNGYITVRPAGGGAGQPRR